MTDRSTPSQSADEPGRVKNRPLRPGEREALLQRRKDAEALPGAVAVESGHNLALDIYSASIVPEKREIHVSLLITGTVRRPEATATAKERTLVVKIPAVIEER